MNNTKENDEVYNTFCKNIKFLLKEMNIKQKEICGKFNLSDAAFCAKINNSAAKFNLYELLKLSDEVGEYIEDLCKPDFIDKYFEGM